ncbi:hypothetical protein N7467_005600 [Penicillium canescens]|nr:hypothetical protein N7467_005600 [Penicillium canescens]
MSATKRKLPTPTEPKVRLLRRLPARSLRWQYTENTDSDSDGYIGGSPLLATIQSKAGSGRGPAKQEDSEGSYFDGSEDDEDDETEKDNDKLGHKGALRKQGGDDTDENALPSVTIIPLERMRGPGSTEYVDFKMHPNSLMFLTELKVNNNRAWLKTHDDEYRRAFQDWKTFVERTTIAIISLDDTIPELPAKDVIFRIYRDLRFSDDKKPYKAHFSAAWSRTGRKGTYAHYYIHCEPRMSFIAGGIFAPSIEQLRRLRISIDERPRQWRRVMNETSLRQTFLPNVETGSERDEALKAFARENKELALKTKPKASGPSSIYIELLKLKKFTVSKRVPDELFCAEDTQGRVTEILRPLFGFVTFLNSIVMPDGDSDDLEDDSPQDDA